MGESEAIVLAIELEADYVILDDFAARKEAVRLGLNVYCKSSQIGISKVRFNFC